MDTFSIGEIAIGQGFLVNIDFNGVEGEITGELVLRLSEDKSTGEVILMESYQIVWASGEREHVAPKNIRKKKPPTQYKDKELNKPVSWDDIKTIDPFNPSHKGEVIFKPEKIKEAV